MVSANDGDYGGSSMEMVHALGLSAAVLLLGACATTPREASADKLARYQSFAGEPVRSIPYNASGSRGFDIIDEEHMVVEIRPTEGYLFSLSGPCLRDSSAPVLNISSQVGRVSAGFDRVSSLSQPGMTCIVKEIRPLDLKGLRAAEKAAASPT